MAVAEAPLPSRPVRTAADAPLKIVVDDLHVVYRLWITPPPEQVSGWRRLKVRRPIPEKKEVRALRGVSFVARQGEAIGVIGKNGSGKSTLMRAIAGLLPPAQGRVYADGQPTLLGVNSALIKALPGARNIELGLLALGLTPAEVKEKFDDIVEFSGIGDAVNLPMRSYSSGMGARLKFAIASSVPREILLIDEALATGDGEFLKRSAERIQRLREEADTIFLVSHSMSSVKETCDRVIWLDEGRIAADGDPEVIIPEYEARFGLKTRKSRKDRRRKRRERLHRGNASAADLETDPKPDLP
jgi:teichoic acid transport system ATP-binding protein